MTNVSAAVLADIQAFFDQVSAAVIAGDMDAVASLCVYPHTSLTEAGPIDHDAPEEFVPLLEAVHAMSKPILLYRTNVLWAEELESGDYRVATEIRKCIRASGDVLVEQSASILRRVDGGLRSVACTRNAAPDQIRSVLAA